MGYLLYTDYKRIIQSDNLQQIISDDDSIRTTSEAAAYEEVISYLIQKYNVTEEFKETAIWDYQQSYYAGQTLQIDAPQYIFSISYALNDLVSISGKTYICNTANSGGTFNSTYWTLLGNQYDLFKVDLPQQRYVYGYDYKVGDKVFWENKVYTAITQNYNVYPTDINNNSWIGETYEVPAQTIIRNTSVAEIKATGATISLGTGSTIVSGNTLNISFNSIDFGTYICTSPTGLTNADEAILISNMFNLNTSGYSCTVSAETLTFTPPSDLGSSINGLSFICTGDIVTTTTPWSGGADFIPKYYTKGDGRNQQLVGTMIDIALYHIHSRVAPRNIPDLRVKRYDDAKKWLKMCAHGEITPNILLKTPRSGCKIRIGSQTKNSNSY